MRGVVIHAPKDLRLDELDEATPGPDEVRVAIAAGGICGSDLHYFHAGGFGTVRIKEPMVLGHEVSGVVAETGPGVEGLPPGTRVAIHPGRACGACEYCHAGMRNQCSDMRFLGSAMRFPHVQGGFRQQMVVHRSQLIPIPAHLSLGEAAMAEPLAVCLHAVSRAGPLQGRRVLVTGCGPIGALCVAAARQAGAVEVVATDVHPNPLATALKLGADRALDVAADPAALQPWTAGRGRFDVVLEASGTTAALKGAFDALKPGGIVVQLGLGGEMTLPMNMVVAKEFELRGTFRFDREFALGLELMATGRIDVKPVLTATIPFERADEAFALASDRSRAMKVQLAF